MKPKVYLAGPISGLSYNNSTEWREDVQKQLVDSGIDCYSPLRGKSYLKQETNISDSYEDSVLSSQKGIFNRDSYDCQHCDLIFVNLLNTERVSIGTVMEIAWGWAFRKPIVLIIEKEGNLHNHSMVREASSFIVNNVEDAVWITKTVLLPMSH